MDRYSSLVCASSTQRCFFVSAVLHFGFASSPRPGFFFLVCASSPRRLFFASAALLHLGCASSSRPVLFISRRRLLSSLTAEGRPVVSRGSRSWFDFSPLASALLGHCRASVRPPVDRSPDKRSPTHLSVIHNSLDLS